ncbi:hypothetical protein GCM10023223_26190 [Stackebrandtia albiflava]
MRKGCKALGACAGRRKADYLETRVDHGADRADFHPSRALAVATEIEYTAAT